MSPDDRYVVGVSNTWSELFDLQTQAVHARCGGPTTSRDAKACVRGFAMSPLG